MRKIFCFIFSALLFSLVFSCSDEEAVARLSKAEKEALRRADSAALKIGVLPTEDCLPIVVAKELRLFDTLGVSVHLRHYGAMSECRIALRDSLVQGAVIDSLLMSQMKALGTSLYEGMKTDMRWQFLTSRKARVSRMEQMADKNVAADSHGESHRLAEAAVDSLVKKGQLVFIIQVEDLKIRTKMLNTGNVDAALLPEPFATKARNQGANVIKSVKSSPVGVLALRTESMKPKERKEQFRLFLKAVDAANDSIKKYGKAHYMKLLEW